MISKIIREVSELLLKTYEKEDMLELLIEIEFLPELQKMSYLSKLDVYELSPAQLRLISFYRELYPLNGKCRSESYSRSNETNQARYDFIHKYMCKLIYSEDDFSRTFIN